MTTENLPPPHAKLRCSGDLIPTHMAFFFSLRNEEFKAQKGDWSQTTQEVVTESEQEILYCHMLHHGGNML